MGLDLGRSASNSSEYSPPTQEVKLRWLPGENLAHSWVAGQRLNLLWSLSSLRLQKAGVCESQLAPGHISTCRDSDARKKKKKKSIAFVRAKLTTPLPS